MKPNPSLPLYDMLADEALYIMVENNELMDNGEFLSFEILRAYRACKMLYGNELPQTEVRDGKAT